MDGVHLYLKEHIEEMKYVDLDGLIDRYREMIGFDWTIKKENPWDFRMVQFPELEVRSALEFIRPELTERQISLLNEIDRIYKGWIDEGIFYKSYQDSSGGKFSWQRGRQYTEELLGRSIPKSHWWLWPSEE